MTTTLLPHKFGPYGGQFGPETLMPALIEWEQAFVDAQNDKSFRHEFEGLLASFVGRPTNDANNPSNSCRKDLSFCASTNACSHSINAGINVSGPNCPPYGPNL